MNFLGHLFFSNNELQLMHANLYGDFVKGKDLSQFDSTIQTGIRLHRKIDSYIDHHPDVLELMHVLQNDLSKVSGIAVDIYFDHILAKNWEKYHPSTLRDFIGRFYTSDIQFPEQYSKKYHVLFTRMKEFDWINQYQFHYGMTKALISVGKRISFENDLINAPDVFLKHESIIESTFEKFIKDAIPYFSNELTILRHAE